MFEEIETAVVGAGQAGLAASYLLQQRGRNHVVLERAHIGEAWRSGRWDSFTLVTPNWTLQLPGFAYHGDAPDAFLTRDEMVAYLEAYAHSFHPPLRTGVAVTAIRSNRAAFRIETSAGEIDAQNVIVATGGYHMPKLPAYSAQIAPHITQLHSSAYRNPEQLPTGAVLVVGGGQSGCQIAHELCQVGRKTYLSAGHVGSLPRRYRGHDCFWWADKVGMLDRSVDKLPSPAARFFGSPQVSGRDGGQSLDLHRLAAAGVVLLGHTQDAFGTTLHLADDLMANLAFADKFAADFKAAADAYLVKQGMDAPPDDAPTLRDGYDAAVVRELDLDAAGISTVIWATGYALDFRWIHFPIFDEYGYPYQRRGVTTQPGLYFLGLPWLHALKSPLLIGVGEDAAHVVDDLVRR